MRRPKPVSVILVLGICIVASGYRPAEAGSRPPGLVLAVSPTTVVGGAVVTVTIAVDEAALAKGIPVQLGTMTPSVAVIEGADPATGVLNLTIPERSKTVLARVRVLGQSESRSGIIQASAQGQTVTASFSVSATTLTSLVISPASALGGSTLTGTIQLTGVAPVNTGVPVILSTRSAGVTVPALVTVPPGKTSTTFAVNTSAVVTDVPVTITAAYEGTVASTAFTVLGLRLSSVQINPTSVSGGASAVGTVILSRAAGRPLAVSLNASSSDAAVPATILISPSSDRANFTISTRSVGSTRTVVIKASLPNGASTTANGTGTGAITDGTSNTILVGESAPPEASASLTLTSNIALVSAPTVQSIVAQPTVVAGGSPVSFTVTLQPSNMSSTLSVSVALSTNQPQLLQIPAHIAIPPGTSSFTVGGTTAIPGSDQTVTITAGSGTPATTTLLVQASPPLATFALQQDKVKGGENIIAQLTFKSAVVSPADVTFTTDHPELVALPGTVTRSNPGPFPFAFRTAAVKVPTQVSIHAKSGTQALTATVTITPSIHEV